MGTYNMHSRKTRLADSLPQPPGTVSTGTRWHPPRQAAQVLPPLGAGQVYVTRRGTAYHPGWCQVVQRTWEFNRSALQVCPGGEIGARRLCRSCEGESRHP